MDNTLLTVRAQQIGTARTETLMGHTYRVVPAVLIRSQVLHNNLGDSFLPAEAFTSDWASVWNGIPVLVGSHPVERGMPASGRQPEIMDRRGVGFIFNAHISTDDDGTLQLSGEVWLEVARSSEVEGFQAVLDQLDTGDAVELSTGFSTLLEQQTGTHNGEQFNIVLSPQGADHLIISTEMIGACSVGDGCGLGVNDEEAGNMNEQTTCATCGPDKECTCSGNDQEKHGLSALFKKVAGLWERKKEWNRDQDDTARRIARELDTLNAEHPSDREREQMLRDALQGEFGGANRHVIVTDVFTDEMEVIYWFDTPVGPEPKGAEFFRSTFEEAADGSFTFAEPELVRRHTQYRVVAGNESTTQQEEVMSDKETKKQSAEAAAAAEQEKKAAAGRAKAEAEAAEKADQVKAEQAKAEAEAAAQATDPIEARFVKMEAEISTLKQENKDLKDVTKPAVDEREQERQTMVSELAANDAVPFTQAELEARPITELRKLQAMARGESYIGRGGPSARQSGEGETKFMEPVSYFAKGEDKKEE